MLNQRHCVGAKVYIYLSVFVSNICPPSAASEPNATASDAVKSPSEMVRTGAEVNRRKPKASDYVDVVNALILRAASEYESLISTRDAFPDTAKKNKWARLAWKNAGLAAKEMYPLLDSISLLVCGMSLLRVSLN